MTIQEIIQSENVSLIDVRDSYELEIDGHVENAINIPLGEIPNRLEEIKSLKSPVVVFCRGGSRAASVLEYLSENGIKECYNGGGFENVNEILSHSKTI